MRIVKFASIAAAVIAFSGCSDDDTNDNDNETAGIAGTKSTAGTGTTDGDAGAGTTNGGAGPGPGDETPLFATFSSIFSGDPRLNYVNLTPSLDEGEELDLKGGLEVAGYARFFAPEKANFFVIGNTEAVTLERWDIDEQGEPKKGGVLSLLAAGVTDVFNNNIFLSDTKAYYVDDGQAQIVVWNPKTMKITGNIPIPETGKKDLSTYFGLAVPIVRPGRVLITMGWHDVEVEVSPEETGLLVVDTENDEVVSFESNGRCASANQGVILENGDAYFATDIYHLIWNSSVRGKTKPGCVLRIKAGEEEFDPDYLLELSEATGGGVGTGMGPAGDDGKVFISVLDQSKAEWVPELASAELTNAVWQWWILDLETGEASLSPGAEYSTAGVSTFTTDGRTFINKGTDDYATSQLFEVESGAELTPRIGGDASYIQRSFRVR